MRVKLVNASECFLTDGLLVVGEKQAAELLSLEEVLAVIFRL